LIESEEIAKEQTQRVFADVAASVNLPFVQIKTRLKGDERRALKTVRMVLNVTGDVMKDLYGVQCVVRTDLLDETKRFAKSIEDRLRSRNPDCVISPVQYAQSERGDWKGYKAYDWYGDGLLVIPIASQFLPLNAYWSQRNDHHDHEERQLRDLDELRSTGEPVDALLAAVECRFTRAAQEWRDVHSSSV